MKLNEVLDLLGFSRLSDEIIISSFQIDSRNVGFGDLFFAIRGQKTDGHLYLEEVKKRGAIGAIVSSTYQGPDFGLFLLRVENVVETLHFLAKAEVAKQQFRVAAITGSVGKTTTKEFLAELLSNAFRVGKTEGSQNSQLTMPLTILNRKIDDELMVLEMGMSEPNEIEKLIKIAPAEVALLTKIGLAHVAAFPDGIDGIAREKSHIFLGAKKAIFPVEFLKYTDLVNKIEGEKITFSLTERSADYFLNIETGVLDERGIRAYEFELPFQETHFLHNFLAAISAARAFGLSWDLINQKIKNLKLPKMRFEVFEKDQVLFVNDGYNSNPSSLKAALESFPKPKEGGKRIGIIGPMAELGKLSFELHVEMGKLAQKHVDHLLVYGDEAKPLLEGFLEGARPGELFLDKKDLVMRLKELMREGDVVLVKARRTEKMEEIFQLLEI